MQYAAIQKAIKLYFKGETTECFDLLDTLHGNGPTGEGKPRLKKTLTLLLVGELFGMRTCALGMFFYPAHVHLPHKNEDTKAVGRRLLKNLTACCTAGVWTMA